MINFTFSIFLGGVFPNLFFPFLRYLESIDFVEIMFEKPIFITSVREDLSLSLSLSLSLCLSVCLSFSTYTFFFSTFLVHFHPKLTLYETFNPGSMVRISAKNFKRKHFHIFFFLACVCMCVFSVCLSSDNLSFCFNATHTHTHTHTHRRAQRQSQRLLVRFVARKPASMQPGKQGFYSAAEATQVCFDVSRRAELTSE